MRRRVHGYQDVCKASRRGRREAQAKAEDTSWPSSMDELMLVGWRELASLRGQPSRGRQALGHTTAPQSHTTHLLVTLILFSCFSMPVSQNRTGTLQDIKMEEKMHF